MNLAQKKFLKGFFLSFIFIFVFLTAILGFNLYLLPVFEVNGEPYSGSMSEANAEKDLDPGNIEKGKEEINSKSVLEPKLLEEEIYAKEAICVKTDLAGNTEIIFEKNKDSRLPIASLTKLMTALVVFDNYSLSEEILLTENILPNQPLPVDFKTGDSFIVEDLLRIMLIESNNKAAYILSTYMGNEKFISLMNKKTEEIGMSDTFFSDTTGLDEKNISTAKDLSVLTEYILKEYPEIAQMTIIKNHESQRFREISNTNQLLPEFPETVLSKTGFTNEANGCLLMVLKNTENSNYFINIVLGADDRFLEMKKIINKGKQQN
jgi:D-alanyl-D-alanine carboxypeptidase (penicillin-binding protein 5/6)